MYSFMLWNPVSARRMTVGVCCGRHSIALSALLNIVSTCSMLLFVGSHDSEPYFMIGFIVRSFIYQIALIRIPLNFCFLFLQGSLVYML